MQSHEYYMQQALQQAQLALEAGEVPVGAVVVMQDRIIARGYNQTETLHDPTAHAEMIALTAAFNFLGAKYLPDAALYVTLEPCLMCAGALYWSKIGKVVWGADDIKNGHEHFTAKSPFHPKTITMRGILAADCAILIKDFFKHKRS